MTFRIRLLLLFVFVTVLTVGIVAWAVSRVTIEEFGRLTGARMQILNQQYEQELRRRGDEIVHRVQSIADTEATIRMALDMARTQPDFSLYQNDAKGLANLQQLKFLELVAPDGTILSSAHWPARFGQKNEWVTQVPDWKSQGAFLMKEQDADGFKLALLAVRTVEVGSKKLYIIGGQAFDREFLSVLVPPPGTRILLYKNLEANLSPTALVDSSGPVLQAERFFPMIEKARRERREVGEEVRWSSTDPSSLEVIIGNPLLGRSADVLGVIFVGNSRRELIELARFIQATALLAAAIGIGLGVLVSWWAAARVTQPVQELVTGARQVAAGDWSVRVAATGGGEIGELGRAFNRMTGQLAETRERLVQSERVAAWRELARRLAHELKNPLHPLQITIENLERARTQHPEQFEEVFRESTRTLLTELGNLKGIVGRFSDFAKMPAPQPEPVNVNEVVRSVLRLFDAQLNATSAPNVTPEIYLEEHLPVIQADPSQVQRALQNLVLNALDAMPEGGKLTIRTRANGTSVRLEVSDTGAGLTKEECERLFTPYYTTKHQGTGLGLAIVQSVVSDHGGKISVESEPGAGTTFRIELPEGPPEPVLHSTTEN